MTPATILHLSSTSGPGGAEMIVKRLAGALDPERFRSVVCLFRTGWLSEACEQASLPTHVIDINGAFDVRWARKFFHLLQAERVALIHAHEFTANTYGTLLGRLAGIPVVATVHGKNYYSEQGKRRTAYRFVSRAARMVSVSEDLKQFVVERVSIPPSRIKVIYNGVEIPPLFDGQRVLSSKKELNLMKWDHVIGSVGSLYPVKGQIHLIRALPAILRVHLRTGLVLVGRGDLAEELKAETVRLGVEEHVQFLGFRSDIPVLLNLMDVFVLPSLSEGLSMALLEAMAAECPVVATRVGGNVELVEEGVTGYLVPSENSQLLAERVIDLLRNKEEARRFGHRGRERVREKFSLAGMVDAYQECYCDAIAGH
jgi:glycosyltransferase involved in cell wall biosynthesis